MKKEKSFEEQTFVADCCAFALYTVLYCIVTIQCIQRIQCTRYCIALITIQCTMYCIVLFTVKCTMYSIVLHCVLCIFWHHIVLCWIILYNVLCCTMYDFVFSVSSFCIFFYIVLYFLIHLLCISYCTVLYFLFCCIAGNSPTWAATGATPPAVGGNFTKIQFVWCRNTLRLQIKKYTNPAPAG